MLTNRHAKRRSEIQAGLMAARARTLRLLDRVPDSFLKVRVHDFYSPVGWHFGHIAMTEEYWTVVRALGLPCENERLSLLYANLPDNPKDNRVHLPERSEIARYLAATRARALAELNSADLGSSNPLLKDGYAWEFALQHECQHQETILELLHLIRKRIDDRSGTEPCWLSLDVSSLEIPVVRLSCGQFTMGSDRRNGYDNEKRAHTVEVEGFALDAMPVSAAHWAGFIRDGGYRRRSLWSAEGWAWRCAEGAERPEYWVAGPDGVDPADRAYGFAAWGPFGLRSLHPREPVFGVSFYEAAAYAHWSGGRLPTEAEWEYAASGTGGNSRQYPWGETEPNDARTCFARDDGEPGPSGTRTAGATPEALHDMGGSVWAWTSSPFIPYPGFDAYPYDGYSKEHMDGRHRVCRGGSWATAAPILRCSFRNWYVPGYRQGFLGVRCAR